jgi:hypothetical protein
MIPLEDSKMSWFTEKNNEMAVGKIQTAVTDSVQEVIKIKPGQVTIDSAANLAVRTNGEGAIPVFYKRFTEKTSEGLTKHFEKAAERADYLSVKCASESPVENAGGIFSLIIGLFERKENRKDQGTRKQNYLSYHIEINDYLVWNNDTGCNDRLYDYCIN